MKLTFTVELTEEEAATVWRMAERSGVPFGQIDRTLHRSNPFSIAVSLATGNWQCVDDATGLTAPDPADQSVARVGRKTGEQRHASS